MSRAERIPWRVGTALVAVCVVLGVVGVSPALAQFGLERFAFSAQNESGTPDVQAGSHPYSLTATFVLNQPTCTSNPGGAIRCAVANLKDARVELPPGFVGDPDATPRCTYQELSLIHI